MPSIHPRLVTDEKMHPIAVQIDYADWLEIQKILPRTKSKNKTNLEKYAGSIKLKEDSLKYQKRIRKEWG